MHPGGIVPRFILLAGFLIVVLTCSPTSAGTINVSGSLNFSQSGIHMGHLEGDRGFTADTAFIATPPSGLGFACGVPCPPGAVIPVASDNGYYVHATLEGHTFASSGMPGVDDLGSINLRFTGLPLVLPPVNVADTVTLMRSVQFTGSFTHGLLFGPIENETLLASAVATVVLIHNFDGTGWRVVDAAYDLQPTAEPATLLLFGSTLTGLALARWKRRVHN